MSPVPVARSLDEARSLVPKNSGVTLGVFDGVHRGHGKVIETLLEARRKGHVDRCYLVTFDPHPLVVTHSKMTPPMLTTIDERIALIGGYPLEGIAVLPFDEHLAQVDYRTFLERYLQRTFDMRLLVLGYDCHFGKDRAGSPEKAAAEGRRLGFETRIVPAVREGDDTVSSTKIRNSLIEGDLAEANRLLGHPYLIAGTVVRGHGKGHELGFPTANLALPDPYKLWPPRGVYAVKVDTGDETLGGMMNVGRAPTMKSLGEDAREVEVHLFDFEGDLYGRRLLVHCHRYLRDERTFPSAEALVRQLEADKTEAVRSLGG